MIHTHPISSNDRNPFIRNALQTRLAAIDRISKSILDSSRAKCWRKLLTKVIKKKLARWAVTKTPNNCINAITNNFSGLSYGKSPIHQPVVSLIAGATGAVLAMLSATTLAQQPVWPLPKSGGCPLGYYSSGSYCVPSMSANTRGAIEKSGSSCPIGFYSSGNYCLSSPSNNREAIQKQGNSCPIGWFSSGNYCVKNR